MIKHILVPVDGSEGSNKALQQAIEIGIQMKSKITVIAVTAVVNQTPPWGRPGTTMNKKVSNAEIEAHKNLLAHIELDMEDYPHSKEFIHKTGYIAKEIIDYAETEGVDLIVMGSRGLSALSRTFLGSISNKVLNNTIVSVLIVK